MTYIHSVVIGAVFTKIMVREIAKEAWDTLNVAFQSNNKIRQMKNLTLIREFELLKMKNQKTLKHTLLNF